MSFVDFVNEYLAVNENTKTNEFQPIANALDTLHRAQAIRLHVPPEKPQDCKRRSMDWTKALYTSSEDPLDAIPLF